jgi:deoxyribodipyrimidine photo-lyase
MEQPIEKTKEKIIVWFRNDLRLHDNEMFFRALQKQATVIPVFCFDLRQFKKTELGFPKTDAFRAKFLLEAVSDLKNQLQKLGTDLVIRIGEPEQLIPAIQQEVGAKAVFASKEVASEEIEVEQKLETQLFKTGCKLNLYWQTSLYHLDDLPFPIKNLPDVYTQFRKEVERGTKIRNQFATPQKLSKHEVSAAPVPTLADLGFEPLGIEKRSVLHFEGGETAGKARLKHYFWEKDLLRNYKETRNGLVGADYSSKFSAWLALGCLSPRYIYDEVKRYERERTNNDSTYWLVFELIWRDYFRFVAKKYGSKIFRYEGIRNENLALKDDKRLFEKWKEGKTGVPFVDANMIELKKTGFMSNRGRQNVASYLVKDLKVNWQWGAMWFESQLIDYDVCSNWGNWNYVAGIGNDPRENRYFNIPSQAQKYDPKGEYVRLWLGTENLQKA